MLSTFLELLLASFHEAARLVSADVENTPNFKLNFKILEVKAVKMTSTRTQLPYEYYSLLFCLPKNGTVHYKSKNLGEVLRGNSIKFVDDDDV
jgi:hypothetical protein